MQKKNTLKYTFDNFDPEKLDSQHIDRLAIERVPEKTRVLDIGCATGFMGEYLRKKKKCTVYGVEIREEERAIAKKKLDGVFAFDIEEEKSAEKIVKEIQDKKFDVILATSLIEHLKDPNKFLQICKKLLKPNGLVIVSTPNIAHWTIRYSLLKGNFDYTDYGILDNTHLHFFTLKSFREIFEKNNYSVRELVIDPVGGGYPKISRIFARWFPALFAYQMVIVTENGK